VGVDFGVGFRCRWSKVGCEYCSIGRQKSVDTVRYIGWYRCGRVGRDGDRVGKANGCWWLSNPEKTVICQFVPHNAIIWVCRSKGRIFHYNATCCVDQVGRCAISETRPKTSSSHHHRKSPSLLLPTHPEQTRHNSTIRCFLDNSTPKPSTTMTNGRNNLCHLPSPLPTARSKVPLSPPTLIWWCFIFIGVVVWPKTQARLLGVVHCRMGHYQFLSGPVTQHSPNTTSTHGSDVNWLCVIRWFFWPTAHIVLIYGMITNSYPQWPSSCVCRYFIGRFALSIEKRANWKTTVVLLQESVWLPLLKMLTFPSALCTLHLTKQDLAVPLGWWNYPQMEERW
jgi:hypothetical protein